MSQLPGCLTLISAVQLQVFSSGHCLLCVTVHWVTEGRKESLDSVGFWSITRNTESSGGFVSSYVTEGVFTHLIIT